MQVAALTAVRQVAAFAVHVEDVHVFAGTPEPDQNLVSTQCTHVPFAECSLYPALHVAALFVAAQVAAFAVHGLVDVVHVLAAVPESDQK